VTGDPPGHLVGDPARAVCDALYRFAEGLDLRDWDLYRSVFTDEIEVDCHSYRPGSRGRMRADDWVARGRAPRSTC
jgi:3-phenylpropionate/cinnamic acid dioxygenase small subunit